MRRCIAICRVHAIDAVTLRFADFVNAVGVLQRFSSRVCVGILQLQERVMSKPNSARSVMVGLAFMILIGAAVLWWDAGMNEGLATKPVLLAGSTTLNGIMFLLFGLRRKTSESA